MNTPFHCCLDVFDAPQHLMTDTDFIKSYIGTCVRRLNLTAIGEPMIYKFDAPPDNPSASGITATQILAESLFSLHTYGESGSLYVDCFSCRPFKSMLLYDITKRMFGTEKIYLNMVKRQSIKNV